MCIRDSKRRHYNYRRTGRTRGDRRTYSINPNSDFVCHQPLRPRKASGAPCEVSRKRCCLEGRWGLGGRLTSGEIPVGERPKFSRVRDDAWNSYRRWCCAPARGNGLEEGTDEQRSRCSNDGGVGGGLGRAYSTIDRECSEKSHTGSFGNYKICLRVSRFQFVQRQSRRSRRGERPGSRKFGQAGAKNGSLARWIRAANRNLGP